MNVTLQIKKINFDLILKGTKKNEFREPSLFNKRLLLKDRGDGMKEGNTDIKFIQFINGYSKDARKLLVEVLLIRPVNFTKNTELPEDNFIALEGQKAIHISLGNIVNT